MFLIKFGSQKQSVNKEMQMFCPTNKNLVPKMSKWKQKHAKYVHIANKTQCQIFSVNSPLPPPQQELKIWVPHAEANSSLIGYHSLTCKDLW